MLSTISKLEIAVYTELPIPPSLDRDAIDRMTMASIGDRSWYWIDTMLTPTPLEWEIINLPQWLFPLYYWIRLIRLILKHALKVEI